MISAFVSLVHWKYLFAFVLGLTLLSFLIDLLPIAISSSVQDTHYLWKHATLTLMPLVYFIAFLSASVQVRGLVGSTGLIPYPVTLSSMRSWCDIADKDVPAIRYISIPLIRSILYLFSFELSADAFISKLPYVGMILSVLTLLLPNPVFYFALWYMYYIIKRLMGPFFNLQWDALLLESGLLLVLLPLPHTPLSLLLLNYAFRYLTFRLMFGSGFVKLTSGDASWINGSAMSYHYLTQPLPTALAPFMHSLKSLHYWMTFGTIIVEVLLPLVSFLPIPALRTFVALNYIALNIAIAITGNYGFFNVLTMVLSCCLISDATVPLLTTAVPANDTALSLLLLATMVFIFLLLSISYAISLNTLFSRSGTNAAVIPPLLEQLQTCCNVLYTGGHYGLFANMTKFRDEVTIFISNDGSQWVPLRFHYKPNITDTTIAALFPVGHLPRLDWLLWFIPLRVSQPLPRWFYMLLMGILEQQSDIVALLHPSAAATIAALQPQYTYVQLYHFTYDSNGKSVWLIEQGDDLLPPCSSSMLRATIASVDNIEATAERRKSLQAVAIVKSLLAKLREEKKSAAKTPMQDQESNKDK